MAASGTDRREKPLGLAWAVSGRGMLVRCVCEAADAKLLPVQLLSAVTDRACEFEAFAAQRGVPVTRIAPPQSDRSRFDREMAETFAGSGADWAGLTFNRLIGAPVIDAMGGRVLNVHFAMLPLFPGFGGIEKAVSSGMRVAGATVHLVDGGMDTGPILAQVARGIAPGDNAATLGRRLFEAISAALLQVLRALAEGDLILDADRRPAWSSSYAHRAARDGFPAVDADLADFARQFRQRLTAPAAAPSADAAG